MTTSAKPNRQSRDGGETGNPSPVNTAGITLLDAAVTAVKSQPHFGATQSGSRAQLDGEIDHESFLHAEKAEEIDRVTKIQDQVVWVPLKPTAKQITLSSLCIIGLLVIGLASLFNPAGFARDHLGTDGWLRALIFSSPFLLGGVLAKFALGISGQWQRYLERLLVFAGVVGFGLYLFEFCRHFAIEQPIGGLGSSLDEAGAVKDYSWMLLGQLVAESVASYALVTWFILVNKPAVNPLWETIQARLLQLRAERDVIQARIIWKQSQQAILAKQEQEYQALHQSLKAIAKVSLDN